MDYFWGALAGCAWGAIVGSAKYFILWAKLIRSERAFSERSLSSRYMLSMVFNIVALLVVYFVRGLLPFSTEVALVSTAIMLALLSRLYPITKFAALSKKQDDSQERGN
jgi:uncharacterized membrane protein